MSKSSNSSGINLSGILFLIFLVLKLTNVGMVATWSWWWVFSPIWIPALFVFIVLLFTAIIKVFVK